MGSPRYTDEFKREAVTQVLERGYTVVEVAKRIGVSRNSLSKWLSEDPRNPDSTQVEATNKDLQVENARLKAELRRVQEERDILKKAAAYFANQSE